MALGGGRRRTEEEKQQTPSSPRRVDSLSTLYSHSYPSLTFLTYLPFPSFALLSSLSIFPSLPRFSFRFSSLSAVPSALSLCALHSLATQLASPVLSHLQSAQSSQVFPPCFSSSNFSHSLSVSPPWVSSTAVSARSPLHHRPPPLHRCAPSLSPLLRSSSPRADQFVDVGLQGKENVVGWLSRQLEETQQVCLALSWCGRQGGRGRCGGLEVDYREGRHDRLQGRGDSGLVDWRTECCAWTASALDRVAAGSAPSTSLAVSWRWRVLTPSRLPTETLGAARDAPRCRMCASLLPFLPFFLFLLTFRPHRLEILPSLASRSSRRKYKS